MSYRKFKADYLFDGYKMLEPGQVLITGDDGTVRAVLDRRDAGEGVEEFQGLICPGFVNCHCHLELSHLKGQIPMGIGLVDFVLSVVSQRKKDDQEIHSAIQTAEAEMLGAGIVAVGDICNTSDTLREKAARRLAYYNFIELAGWLPEQAENRFRAGKSLYSRFAELNGTEEHLSINPHAPYSVSAALWDRLKGVFPHKTVTIHNQETAAEDEFFQSAQGELIRMYATMQIDYTRFTAPGTGSMAFYLHELEPAKNILLVHNTFSGTEDLARAIAFSPGLFFCLCPNANLYIENRLPDIPAMVSRGGNLVIGTDSLASNPQLSILEEMKTIKKYFPLMDPADLLRWATSNGARALQFENEFGDFKPGKKPGIVLIEYSGKELLGSASRCRRVL